jgi:hypothetical protein
LLPEEVGFRLQKGIPSRISGTAQEKRLQENSDPGKLQTAEGIGSSRQEDDPQYESGKAQGTRSQEIRPGECGTRNSERTDARKKTVDAPGRHQWNEEPRRGGAATALKREDNQRDRQEDHRAGVREASIRDIQRVAENEEPYFVERSAPSGAENQGLGIV